MSYYLLNLHFIALYMNKSTPPVLVSMLVNKIFCAMEMYLLVLKTFLI